MNSGKGCIEIPASYKKPHISISETTNHISVANTDRKFVALQSPCELLSKITENDGIDLLPSNNNTQYNVKQNFFRNKRKLDEMIDSCTIYGVSKTIDTSIDISKREKIKNFCTVFKDESTWKIIGIKNEGNTSYASSSLQCLFHCRSVRLKFFNNPEPNLLQEAFHIYASEGQLSIIVAKIFAGHNFIQNHERDAADFITQLLLKSTNLQSTLSFDVITEIACTHCNIGNQSVQKLNCILQLPLLNDQKCVKFARNN